MRLGESAARLTRSHKELSNSPSAGQRAKLQILLLPFRIGRLPISVLFLDFGFADNRTSPPRAPIPVRGPDRLFRSKPVSARAGSDPNRFRPEPAAGGAGRGGGGRIRGRARARRRRHSSASEGRGRQRRQGKSLSQKGAYHWFTATFWPPAAAPAAAHPPRRARTALGYWRPAGRTPLGYGRQPARFSDMGHRFAAILRPSRAAGSPRSYGLRGFRSAGGLPLALLRSRPLPLSPPSASPPPPRLPSPCRFESFAP